MNPIRRLRKSNSRPASSRLFEPSDDSLQTDSEELLEELVNIDSTTPDVAGVNRVQRVVGRELERLGFTVSLTPNPLATSGDLLTATLSGERTEDYISFVSHADVVLGIDSVGSYRVLPDALHARGPGIIDNKGGVVIALRGIRRYLQTLREKGQGPRHSLRFICSPNEEVGSPGFLDTYRLYSESSQLVLGFEPALDNGSIIESRRGNRWYQVAVKGQEAHAGRCKGEQINAAHDVAMKIAKLHKLNHVKAGISVNVGQIVAGRDRFNVVCGEAHVKIDARFPSFAARERLHKQIESVLLTPEVRSSVTGHVSETTFEIADDCPPFSATLESRSLLKNYLRSVRNFEAREISAEKAGGAGDVNYMSRRGAIVLDGLGAVGGRMHTTEEFIYLPSLSTRACALSDFLLHADQAIGRQGLRAFLKSRARG